MRSRCAHVLLEIKTKLVNRFFYKKIFLTVFSNKVIQKNQLTRDHMWKCDETKYLSNSGSVKNNFQTILNEFYWDL